MQISLISFFFITTERGEMAGITLDQAKQKLENAMTAYDNALTAQEYSAGTHQKKRMAELRDLQQAVIFWDNQVKKLSRGGVSVRGATPI